MSCLENSTGTSLLNLYLLPGGLTAHPLTTQPLRSVYVHTEQLNGTKEKEKEKEGERKRKREGGGESVHLKTSQPCSAKATVEFCRSTISTVYYWMANAPPRHRATNDLMLVPLSVVLAKQHYPLTG